MTKPYTRNCVTRPDGEIDVDFYVNRARQMRAEAIADMLGRLIGRLKLGRNQRDRRLPMRVNFTH
jgi:hypothetical protein